MTSIDHTDLSKAVTAWIADELTAKAAVPVRFWASFHMNSIVAWTMPEIELILIRDTPSGPVWATPLIDFPPDEEKVRDAVRQGLARLSAGLPDSSGEILP